jgi:hypothetical protein
MADSKKTILHPAIKNLNRIPQILKRRIVDLGMVTIGKCLRARRELRDVLDTYEVSVKYPKNAL